MLVSARHYLKMCLHPTCYYSKDNRVPADMLVDHEVDQVEVEAEAAYYNMTREAHYTAHRVALVRVHMVELVHIQNTVVEDVEEGFVDEGVEVEAQNDCVLVLGRDVAQDDLSEQLGHIILLPEL